MNILKNTTKMMWVVLIAHVSAYGNNVDSNQTHTAVMKNMRNLFGKMMVCKSALPERHKNYKKSTSFTEAQMVFMKKITQRPLVQLTKTCTCSAIVGFFTEILSACCKK